MEAINQELEQKSIERPKGVDFATGEQVIEGGTVNKPKKPRTQAQKDALNDEEGFGLTNNTTLAILGGVTLVSIGLILKYVK